MNKIKKAAVSMGAIAALITGGVAADTANAPDASAAVAQVCHRGPSTNAPVAVLESGGASYLVYPGHCTSVNVPIFGFRPSRSGDTVTWAYDSSYFTNYTAVYKSGQWTATLNKSIVIKNVHSGFGGGGSF